MARKNNTGLTVKKSKGSNHTRFYNDGMRNMISGLGSARDRQTHSYYSVDPILSQVELETFYRNQWVAKAIDGRPFDMTREWRKFESADMDQKDLEAIEALEMELNIQASTNSALTWSALYGGAALIMIVDGQGDISEPLDYTKVQKGQLRNVAVVDRWMLISTGQINYNPLSRDFGIPTHYSLAWDANANNIHPSRVIRFNGRKMPNHISKENLFWGDSLVQRWYDAMMKSDTVNSAIGTMVHEANFDILKMKDLAKTLLRKDGEEQALKRLEDINMGKSVLNMLLVDAEDEVTRNPISFSSLPEIQQNSLQILAGATDYPIRKLLGEQQGGLGNNDEGSTRDYYDSVRSQQNFELAPRLRDLDQVMVRSAIGDYPDGLKFKFNSLWQMTEKEQADLNGVKADTLLKLQDIGMPEDVLLQDAVEQGLTNNMSEEEIEEYSKMPKPEGEENESEFSPYGGGNV